MVCDVLALGFHFLVHGELDLEIPVGDIGLVADQEVLPDIADAHIGRLRVAKRVFLRFAGAGRVVVGDVEQGHPVRPAQICAVDAQRAAGDAVVLRDELIVAVQLDVAPVPAHVRLHQVAHLVARGVGRRGSVRGGGQRRDDQIFQCNLCHVFLIPFRRCIRSASAA